MRQSSVQLPDVLTGSFSRSIRFDVWNGSDRVAVGLPVEGWSLDADLGRDVKSSGSAVIVHESVNGESLKPVGTDGVLSPFRAVVEPVVTISAGSFSEDVSLGQFRVVSVPSSEEFTVDGPSGRVVTGSRVEVEFESLDRVIWRDGLRFPENPKYPLSCWDEMRRLVPLPVVESLPDKPVPGKPTWEAKQGGRLEAVQILADTLGGVPVVNSVGALTVVPDEVGDPVAELTVGESGTIVAYGDSIDTEDVYNEVVGVFEQENDRKPLHAIAQVTSGPLAVDGPYGRYTRYYSSDRVKTQAQALAAVNTVLNRSVAGQSYELPVTCHFNPLIEVGDVVAVVTSIPWRFVRLVGQVVSVRLSADALMEIVVRVNRGLS